MIEVFGNSLASLLVVDHLTRKDIPCNYYFQRNIPVGGHFRGIKLNKDVFDVGMVLVEPGIKTDAIKKNLSEFENQHGFALGPFRHHVLNWFANKKIDLEIMNIKMFFQGKLIEDYILGDNLDFLTQISGVDQGRIVGQISSLNHSNTTIHPKNKRINPLYHISNLESVCKRIYGQTFYELILAKWINKLDYDRKIPAIDHRKIWLPLVYPEDIIEFLLNGFTKTEKPSYLTPVDTSISEIIEEIYKFISTGKKTHLKEVPEFSFENQAKSTKVFLGTSNQLGLKSRSKKEFTDKGVIPLSFEYFATKKHDNFVVNIIDGQALFRTTSKFSSKIGKSIIVVESNQTDISKSNTEVKNIFSQLMDQKMINSEPIKFHEYKSHIRITDKNNASYTSKSSEDALLHSKLLGHIIDSRNQGLHEQVVIALSIIERLEI